MQRVTEYSQKREYLFYTKRASRLGLTLLSSATISTVSMQARGTAAGHAKDAEEEKYLLQSPADLNICRVPLP